MIVTANEPFGHGDEVVGDATIAAAMIDRLVHHADVVNPRGNSYRLEHRDAGVLPTAPHDQTRGEEAKGEPSPSGSEVHRR